MKGKPLGAGFLGDLCQEQRASGGVCALSVSPEAGPTVLRGFPGYVRPQDLWWEQSWDGLAMGAGRSSACPSSVRSCCLEVRHKVMEGNASSSAELKNSSCHRSQKCEQPVANNERQLSFCFTPQGISYNTKSTRHGKSCQVTKNRLLCGNGTLAYAAKAFGGFA